MGIPAFGTTNNWSSRAVFQKDSVSGMGDYLTTEIGSLAWIEATVVATLFDTAFGLLKLMANQIQPAASSAYLSRWADIYNIQGLSSTSLIRTKLQEIQFLTGTPPTLSNVRDFLKELLGSCFLGVQWAPENQYLASNELDQLFIRQQFQMPLSEFLIYVWQPRDNQDNILMPNNVFNEIVESYRTLLENWSPHFAEIVTMNLINRGNQDGYGGGYNGMNYNNYLDGYNVITGTTGSNIVHGRFTTFTKDFFPAINAFLFPKSADVSPPLQIVDDNNNIQTYYVKSVQSDTQLTLTTPMVSNVFRRTYRTLGIPFDTIGALDYGSLFNNFAF